MVQKQAAVSGGYRGDSFADDDPLAELARIVGYDQPRGPARVEPELGPAQLAPARPSHVNLEDELLRELETFEDPAGKRPSAVEPLAEARSEPARPAGREAFSAASPVPVEAPVVVPALAGGPSLANMPERPRIVSQATPVAPRPAPAIAEPLDWAAELAAAEYVDAPRATPPGAAAATTAAADRAIAPPLAVAPASSHQQSRAERLEPRFDAPADSVAPDLADELERAFADAVPADEPQPAGILRAEPGREQPRQEPGPPLRLPLANFQAQSPSEPRRTQPPSPAMRPAADGSVVLPLPKSATDSVPVVSGDLWPELEAAIWTADARPKAQPNPESVFETRTIASATAARAPETQTRTDFVRSEPPPFTFADELAADALDEREASSVPAQAPRPAATLRPVAEIRRAEPTSDPFGHDGRSDGPRAGDPFVDDPFSFEALKADFSLSAPVSRPGRGDVAAPPAERRDVASAFEPVSFFDQPLSMPAQVQPSAAGSAPTRRPEPGLELPGPDRQEGIDEIDGEFELMLDDLDLDLSEFDLVEPKAETSRPAPVSRANPVAQTSPQVPFFGSRPSGAQSPMPARPGPARGNAALAAAPGLLAFDPSDIVETDDHPETVAMPDVPDVAVDEPERQPLRPEFDYELDSELAGLIRPNPPMTARVPEPSTAAAVAKSPASLDDFDAFERALEEDFRRSLEQPQENPVRGGRIPVNKLTPADAVPEGGRRWMLMATVSALVVVAGAVGAFVWFGSHGTSIVASDEPKVILADKNPVKVAPENPGGKSVPNQDKAVYDRVAGETAADPKQRSLISTNEQPMDVVQRTLMPENLPLENEAEASPAGTPVPDTADPRLLPNKQETAAAAGEGDQSAITPRKVKTMIVKPDGTLVAQEIPAPLPSANAANSGPVRAPATNAAPSANGAAAPKGGPLASNQQSAATQAQPQPSAPAPANNPAPALAAPSRTAPPATSPAAQAAASAQTQQAAPAATPTARNAAPVPVGRPAEQPANVVATVTDQGNVRGARPEQAPAPATSAAVPAASASAGSEYVIQIASLPSEAEAEKSYRSLSGKFSSVIGGKAYEIKPAEVAGKGTYYRLRIAAGSKAEAEALCTRYKAAGGTCLVAR